MTIEEALVILETSLERERLNRIQELVFRQVWEGRSYSEIATQFGYDVGYIKNVASQLWRNLSKQFGEKVTKHNVQSVLKRRPDLNRVVAAASGSTQNVLAPVTCFSTSQGHDLRSIDKVSKISAPAILPVVPPLDKGKTGGWEELCLNPSGLKGTANVLDFPAIASHRHHDWGEAIDTSLFQGRTAELTTLKQWIVNDRCRLVAVLGMGGIGKTAFTVKLAQHLKEGFDYLIWRSLRHAPPLEYLLDNLLQVLDNERRTRLPESQEYRISRLIELLRRRRCLLILDNIESILASGDSPDTDTYALSAGYYQQGYEGYGKLFQQIGEITHQSCLILTSREKPKDIAILDGKFRPVRSFHLKGLGLEAKELLKSKGIYGSNDELKELLERYDGNPLALTSVSEIIKEVYQGNLSAFLKQKLLISREVGELLEQHVSRLSNLEKELMYWLTVNSVPVALTDLLGKVSSSSSQQALIETLCSLSRRSLIEVSNSNPVLFAVKPLIREYIASLFEKVDKERQGGQGGQGAGLGINASGYRDKCKWIQRQP
jgi:hypothetical protein